MTELHPMISFAKAGVASLCIAVLLGCSASGDSAPPNAIAMNEDSIGYYCQMYLLDHGGPKAQIHLKGLEQPVWFTQVTHAVDYLTGGERDREVVAVYVSDMGEAASWSKPGETNWIAADTGYYVIDSERIGGMGTPEAIPFGTLAEAEDFRSEEGGRIVQFPEIPQGYGAIDPIAATDPTSGEVSEHGHGG